MYSGKFWFIVDKYKVKHQATPTGHAKWVNNASVQNWENNGSLEKKTSKINSKLLKNYPLENLITKLWLHSDDL